MKAAINVYYRVENYTSDYLDFDDDGIIVLEKLCVSIAKGEQEYLKLRKINKDYYFPKNILMDSIISIVYSN
jgi:hypothetical protein